MEPHQTQSDNATTNLEPITSNIPLEKNKKHISKFVMPLVIVLLSGPILIMIGNHLNVNSQGLILIPVFLIVSLLAHLILKDKNKSQLSTETKQPEKLEPGTGIISKIGVVIFGISWVVSGLIFLLELLSENIFSFLTGGTKSYYLLPIFFAPILMLILYVIANTEAYKRYRPFFYAVPYIYLVLLVETILQ